MRPDISFTIDGLTRTAAYYGLVLGAFDIPVAQPKTNYIEIDGADSSLDLSEAFGLTYSDLVFDLNFQFKRTNLSAVRSFIFYAHGKKAKITPYNDDQRYYDGRLSVSNITSQGGIYCLTVNVVAKPYRLKKEKTVLTVTDAAAGKFVTITQEPMVVVPTFTCAAETQIYSKGKTHTILSASPVVLPDIAVNSGQKIKVTSTGDVVIEFQEGAL